MTSLRDRQRALARRAIVGAVGELVAERRHLDFSVKEVADRAGVSLRTVYNHFPSREHLLDAFGEYFNERMSERGGIMIDQVSELDQVCAAAAINFRIFEELDALSEAWLEIREPTTVLRADRDQRTERITELVGEAVPGLDPAQLPLVGVMVRHMFSSATWHALTRDHGLDVEQTISAAQWAVQAMLAAARGRDLPSDPVPPAANP